MRAIVPELAAPEQACFNYLADFLAVVASYEPVCSLRLRLRRDATSQQF